MRIASFFVNLKRGWWLPTLVGVATFAAIFGALTVVAAALFPAHSATLVFAILAALAGNIAGTATDRLRARHLRWETAQMHRALDSMTQGVSMFDAAERLVVCNRQYAEIYGLAPEDVEPGTTLSDVLARRVAKGTFALDPHEYRENFLRAYTPNRLHHWSLNSHRRLQTAAVFCS